MTEPARENWTSTAWQTLPRLWRVLAEMRPTLSVPDITALDDAFLRRHDVAALLWDVDGTLMAYHDGRVEPELAAAFANLRGKVPQAILSNCGDARLEELGTIFGELPVFKGYRRQDASLVFRCLRGGAERWSVGRGDARAIVARPAGRLKALRKPSAELVDAVIDELDVAPGRRVFMVGDQHVTDIAGANLAGIGSVKVRTVRPETFPLEIRCLQRVERGLFRLLHGRASDAPEIGR
ncbi:MAG TPA: HAD hydrolase-like protein [Polyangia bacterium]|nr:HAD hydrolase-like protein [Polyangia bacterium]